MKSATKLLPLKRGERVHIVSTATPPPAVWRICLLLTYSVLYALTMSVARIREKKLSVETVRVCFFTFKKNSYRFNLKIIICLVRRDELIHWNTLNLSFNYSPAGCYAEFRIMRGCKREPGGRTRIYTWLADWLTYLLEFCCVSLVH